ncbi:restriction endonuclease subunit S [Anoxybacillus eryuanensis]|uniref:restriction endonuclease subunit S n=1 Tax=Anoxybacillus eryuanensis TaxID=651866 RepID=UPI003EF1E82B
MSCSEWKEVKLIDAVEMNPRTILKKGTLAKKVSMQDIAEFTRKIQSYEIAEFTSGSKFKNGDTLFARITPCLENGKTAYVDILEDDEVAFGSTEFIVFRAKEGITDSKFVYYLTISPEFRNIAIKSMTGSSGRQRVQNDVLANTIINLPPLQEQKRIAHLLSVIDDKIELNNEMNKTLEEIAQAIFQRWFVDFEFPNANGEPYKSSGGKLVESELGMIPKRWRVGNFREITESVLGGDWGKESPQGNYIKEVYCLRGTDIPEISIGKEGSLPKRYILEKNHKNKKLNNGDLVVEISGGSPTQSTGRITYVNEEVLSKFDADIVCTNFCRAISLVNKNFTEFFYFYWKMLYDARVFFQYENGTTGIKNLDINTFLDKYAIVIPDNKTIESFHNIISVLLKKIQENGTENKKLSTIRDTLLPKLISGEIRVPDAEREVEACLQKSN